jgi:Calx-beta domain
VIAWGAAGVDAGQTRVPLEASSGVDAIAAGYDFSMALKDGKVIAWGGSWAGQATVPPAAQSSVTAIAAGDYHGLALGTPVPVVAVARRGGLEPEGGAGTSRNFRFNVTLSTPATRTVTASWHTEDRTATAGQDYLAKNGSVRFLAGETEKVITVTVLGDNVVEPTEWFVVKLDQPTAPPSLTARPPDRPLPVPPEDGSATTTDPPGNERRQRRRGSKRSPSTGRARSQPGGSRSNRGSTRCHRR